MDQTQKKEEVVLAKIFEEKTRFMPGVQKVIISERELFEMCYREKIPQIQTTSVFRTFGRMQIRKMGVNSYQLVKVEEWMMKKKEPKIDGEAPLPIDINAKPLDLKSLYKNKIKGEETKGDA